MGHQALRPYFTLWKKDLARFWPLWAVYTAVWFLLIPLEIFNRGAGLARTYTGFGLTGWAGDWAMSQACSQLGVWLSWGYAVLCAMAVWSYLYNPRAVNMTHALPVRREGQFAAHFLSGASFFVLPHGVILALTVIAGLATGSRGDLPATAGAMGVLTLLCLFFFALATLCALITGHLLALPVFYIIINSLAAGVSRLLDWVAEQFLFGFTTSLGASDAVLWLSPVVLLSRELGWSYGFEGGGTSGTSVSIGGIPRPEGGAVSYTVTPYIEGLNILLIYTAAAVALAALALLLYRRRHLEAAGDVVAVPWLRPVFQYGVAFCAALAGAWVLTNILGRMSRPLLTAALVLWGVVGCFAARMLLQKSLKVFKTGWKGAAATVAALLLLCLGLELDVLGLERVIPDAAQVTSVHVLGPISSPDDSADYPGLTVEDPALIGRLLDVHQTVIDHRTELKSTLDAYRSDALPSDGYRFRDFQVEYALQNGNFLKRSYSLLLSQAELDDPESVASALDALINDPAFNRLSYRLDDVEENRLTEAVVRGAEGLDAREAVFYSPLSGYAVNDSPDGEPEGRPELPDQDLAPAATRSDDGMELRPASQAALADLFRAVEADFDAGNLGRRWLFSADNSRICSATLEFRWNERRERSDGEVYYRQRHVTVTLTPGAVNTLAALEALGLFEGGGYLTDGDGERVYPEK